MKKRDQADVTEQGKEQLPELTRENASPNNGEHSRKTYHKPACTKHERVYDIGMGS